MTLIESIYKEPEKWHPSECIFRHESGAQLWIGNGMFFCEPYPGGGFGIVSKWNAWRAYKWWARNAPVEAFGK
jgi:hypothetical protein